VLHLRWDLTTTDATKNEIIMEGRGLETTYRELSTNVTNSHLEAMPEAELVI
jgi:hypothetical protein